MKKLTPKQQRFVDEYLIDLNATEAAIRAGYSKKTARQVGSQNLAKLNIMAAVNEAKAKRAERTNINADWILNRLADEAEADLADLYDEVTGALKPVHQWPVIWRQGLIAGVDVFEEFEGTGKNRIKIGETTRVKVSDRVRRLELIGKHIKVSAFEDRVQHDVSEGLAQLLQEIQPRTLNPGG